MLIFNSLNDVVIRFWVSSCFPMKYKSGDKLQRNLLFLKSLRRFEASIPLRELNFTANFALISICFNQFQTTRLVTTSIIKSSRTKWNSIHPTLVPCPFMFILTLLIYVDFVMESRKKFGARFHKTLVRRLRS